MRGSWREGLNAERGTRSAEIGTSDKGKLRVLDLFSGIGGFSLGLEATGGFQTVALCEIDKHCQKLLRSHWPSVEIISDIRDERLKAIQADVAVGGDPCPCRSLARFAGGGNRSPDLAGFFLAVVAASRPRWVVRENVRAPDVVDFSTALDSLGYAARVIEADGVDFTGQSRRRQFVIGGPEAWMSRFLASLPVLDYDARDGKTPLKAKAAAFCLTAHPRRLAEDNFIIEPGRGIRSLASEERERLQGFPVGWTEGFSWTRRAMMLGKAVMPQKVQMIGHAILEAEERDGKGIVG